MKSVNLDLLKEEIARPDQATLLKPLREFRGSLTQSQVAARWNFLNAMFLSECASLSEGVELFKIGEVAHLCGSHAKSVELRSLDAFVNRVRLSPKVAAAVPGLQDYCRAIGIWQFDLQRTGIRVDTLRDKNKRVVKSLAKDVPDPSRAFYPFIARDPKKDADLLLEIHNAVPKSVPYAIRGDLCQDILVAVLSGELCAENIKAELPKFIRAANKLRPKEMGDLQKLGARLYRKGTSGSAAGIGAPSCGNPDYLHGWQELAMAEQLRPNASLADLREHWGCDHQ